MKLAYLFCTDTAKDRVGPLAWRMAQEILSLKPTGITDDGGEVMKVDDAAGNEIFLVPTKEVASHALGKYVPMLTGPLADCSLAGIVNWHEGGNAPDKIFCVHTNGDVPSGCFPKADPHLTSALLQQLGEEAVAKGLTDWKALPEATHFSGTVYGVSPSKLLELPMPLVDVEIGSGPSSWSNRDAVEALVLGIWRAFDTIQTPLPIVLFVGGMHFEPSLAEGVIGSGMTTNHAGPSCCFGHVLPNHWVVGDGYLGADGVQKVRAAANSFYVKPDILVFHDNLKGPFKSVVRAVAAELGVPASNHRILRRGVDAIRKGA